MDPVVWKAFAIAEGCDILGIFHSQLRHCSDALPDPQLDITDRSTIQVNSVPMGGVFVNLCRGLGTTCYEGAIAQLADQLITMN